jgi:uncharacterized protein YkwD
MPARLLRNPLPRLLRGLGVGLAAALAAGTTAYSSAVEPCAADDATPLAVVERLNALRSASDAQCASALTVRAPQTLAWEARLAASAHEQAVDLALQDRLSHTDSRQRSFGTRLRSVGYLASGAGENLAAGQSSLDDTLAAWLASPSHCKNLMQPEFRDVGLACVQRPGSRYERFWVAHLGAPVRR